MVREVAVQVVGVERSGDLREVDAEGEGAGVDGDELLLVGVADQLDLGRCLEERLTLDELHLQIEEGVLELALVLAVHEEQLHLPRLLPLPPPTPLLLQPEGQPLTRRTGTWRWECACGGHRW